MALPYIVKELSQGIESEPQEHTSNVINLPSTVNTFSDGTNGQVSASVKGRTLKNELNYNRDTWAEWVVTGESSKGNGLITLNRTTENAYIQLDTSLKPNTKYGFLLNVISTNANIGSITNDTDAFANASFDLSSIGNKKIIKTSLSTITNNKIAWRSLNTNIFVQMKDIRAFELPVGSEIETDFNTMTADQLAIKYPYIKGDSTKSTISATRLKSVGKNLLNLHNAKNKNWRCLD